MPCLRGRHNWTINHIWFITGAVPIKLPTTAIKCHTQHTSVLWKHIALWLFLRTKKKLTGVRSYQHFIMITSLLKLREFVKIWLGKIFLLNWIVFLFMSLNKVKSNFLYMHIQGRRESNQPVLSIVLRPLFSIKIVSYEKGTWNLHFDLRLSYHDAML